MSRPSGARRTDITVFEFSEGDQDDPAQGRAEWRVVRLTGPREVQLVRSRSHVQHACNTTVRVTMPSRHLDGYRVGAACRLTGGFGDGRVHPGRISAEPNRGVGLAGRTVPPVDDPDGDPPLAARGKGERRGEECRVLLLYVQRCSIAVHEHRLQGEDRAG